MDVRMEHTAGRGREAEVWLGASLLTVCDGISTAEARTPPGPVECVRFRYQTESPLPVAKMLAGNPKQEKGLTPIRSWAYTGYGQIVSLMPTVIDFGLLRMEDPNWLTDPELIGKHVSVPIDRLEVEVVGGPEAIP